MFIEDTETDVMDITKPIAQKAAEIRAHYNGVKAMDTLQLAAALAGIPYPCISRNGT